MADKNGPIYSPDAFRNLLLPRLKKLIAHCKRVGVHYVWRTDGKIWRVEGGAPSALLRRGWNRNSLPAGTKIIVQAFQARDGDTRASAAEISFPDGRELSLGNPTTEAAAAAAKRAAGEN